MTSSEYQELVEFLAGQFDRVWKEFARVDERFDRVDERFAQVDERFDSIDARFDRVDERFVHADERFAAHDDRFTSIDEQFERQREETRSLVLVTAESLRDEIRLVAEGVTANRELIEVVQSDVRALRGDVESLDTRVSVRLDDHEERIERLEGRSRP